MEMRFYEKIGVRQWKKLVLWLMAQIIRNSEYRRGGNYYLESYNLKAVDDFKKQLWFNAKIHIFAIILNIICLCTTSNIISFSALIQVILFFINLYCIMLQRYNYLRIKRVLNKASFN